MACKKVCDHDCICDLGWFHSYERRCKGGGSWGKRLFDIDFFEFIHVNEQYAFFHNFFFFPRLSWQCLLNKRRARIFQELLCVKTGGRGGGEDKSAVCLQNWKCKHTRKEESPIGSWKWQTQMVTSSWLFIKVKKIKVGMSDTDHGTEETKEHQKCSQMATYYLDSCTYI